MMRYVAGLATVLITLALVACGSGGEDGGNGGNGGNGGVSEAVGTWTLDKDALLVAALAEGKKQLPPGQELTPEMEKMLTTQTKAAMDAMQVTMEVKEDGTFTANMNMMGQKSSAKGTWKLDGPRISFTTTEEDGEAKTEPDTQTATLRDGKIYISDDEMPFEMVMMKQ